MIDQKQVSDSRFHMWRAVVAMAHLDGKVVQEERDFLQHYIETVPFTHEQKQTLRADIEKEQSVTEMLKQVTEAEDQSQFFQFAKMMIWADHDLAPEESHKLEQLMDSQMEALDQPYLRKQMALFRHDMEVHRKETSLREKERAKQVLGLRPLIESVFAGDGGHQANDSRFHMWRAVFALAHADHEVSDDERDFMNKVLAEEDFTPFQEDILKEDMRLAHDPALMFAQITDQNERSNFFHYARLLMWSDGDFDKQEQQILTMLGETQARTVDFDKMVGEVSMEFAEDGKERLRDDAESIDDFRPPNIIARFINRVLGKTPDYS